MSHPVILTMYLRSVSGRVCKTLYVFCFWLAAGVCSAQSSFDFTGPPVLISGAALQQGAVYRYTSVSPGIDALVEIAELNMATLQELDQSDGVERALQPEIDGDVVGSYVEFDITFVDSGTSNARSISGVFSAIDVDSTTEFYTFFGVSDYTVETNTEVTASVVAPQTVNLVGGGAGYVPTSESNTAVVFSFSVNHLSNLIYRVGVNGDFSRQTALLFEPVVFNNAVFSNINDPPVVSNESNTIEENGSLLVAAIDGVLANDTDIDTLIDSDVLSVDSYTVGVDTYPADNSASLIEGELTLNSDGGYQFIPAPNYNGSVPMISYLVTDGKGGSGIGRLSLSVLASNSPPVLTADSAVIENYERLTIPVLANDIDSDGSLVVATLRWVVDLSEFPPGSSLSADLKSLNISGQGSWTIAGSEVEFLPDADIAGNFLPVSYQIDDDSGATSAAQIELIDGLATPPVVLVIEEDQDNNGFIGSAEISGRIDVSAQLPVQAIVGDKVTFVNSDNTEEVSLNSDHLQSGKVAITLNTPVDGSSVDVLAFLTDSAGNQSESASDSAVMDITASNAPLVNIITDSDNSGFISQQEYASDVQVEITLPGTAVVNDKLRIDSGTTTTELILTPMDIANGSVTTLLPNISDGDALSVVAEITDEAGNRSASGSDSAMIDVTAPGRPVVDHLLSSNSTPRINGSLPVDGDYLLSVQVAGIFYASGDGQLEVSNDGNWHLTIPASDALANGVYDVSAVVTDMAGNVATDDTTNELTIDLVVPEVSATNIGPSSDAAPVLSGSSDQPDGTVVMVQTESGDIVCSALVSALQWSCPVQTPLDVGVNNLQAIVTDTAGNIASKIFTVSVVAATDSDSDAIPDDIEGNGDFDNDGVPNYLDLDSDNDTIPDIVETLVDRDADGVRNYLDHDSDNDGIADLQEAHPSSVLDNKDIVQLDSSYGVGENGLADVFESVTDSGVVSLPVDTDKDAVADYLDHDSDNDSISDVVENRHPDANADAMRSDGVITPPDDFDNDGVANYRDLDSDQDGIADIRENSVADADGNGTVDNLSDVNSDGMTDSLAGRLSTTLDLDGDGFANFLDLDSDGDQRLDIAESGREDSNNDGIHDLWLDLNDNGVPDNVDSQLTRGDDVDGDFIDDLYDFNFTATVDTDSDGIIDAFDVDANGDGFADALSESYLQLPDQNADGREDVYEVEVPEAAALIVTGVGNLGAGCSMVVGNKIDGNSKVDLLFLILLLGAVTGACRSRSGRCIG